MLIPLSITTDPKDEGDLTITLPMIVPTVAMTVDWGDGNSNAYEKGVIPEHTYPYPGQYRIQIEADDGFDQVTLYSGSEEGYDRITRIDQWAPQHRVDASGSGFTGDDLDRLVASQTTLTHIPDFKYTDLTDISLHV